MRKFTNSKTMRRQSGTGVLELVATIFTLAIAALIVVNIGVLLFAAWRNDTCCRDAARAAAQRTNAEDAKQGAKLVIAQFATNGSELFGCPTISEAPGEFEFEIFPDESGAPQIAQGPFVRVTTRLQAKLMAPIIYNGVSFTDTINFGQSYAYPIVNPASTGDDEIEDGIDDDLNTKDMDDDTDGDDLEIDA